MVRKTTIVMSASILAAMMIAPALCQAAVAKADLLKQLTQAQKGHLQTSAPAVVAASPKEASQLELDLIVYRWACYTSGEQAEIKDIDGIIPALGEALNDPTISWAVGYFIVGHENSASSLPARDDRRVQLLMDLADQFTRAQADAEKFPVEAVNDLNNALKICQEDLSLDLSEGLIRKNLGDRYSNDMALHHEAEDHYQHASWIFSNYKCVAFTAMLYDDLGTLGTQAGIPANAVENYSRAAQQWETLVPPGGSAYRDLVAREYMRAAEAAQPRDFNTAHELMVNYALPQISTWAHTVKSYGALISDLIEVARLDREHGLYDEAIELLDEAKLPCRADGDPILSAAVFDELAKNYDGHTRNEAIRKRNKILNAATHDCEDALGKIDSPNLTPALRDVFFSKIECGAKCYQELGNYARAASIWKKMADVYARAGRSDAQVQALRSLAAMLDRQSKAQEALEARRSAVEIAMKTDKKTAAEIVHEIVQASIDANDLPNALEGFTEWAPILAQSGDTRGVARALEDRADLLMKNKLYDEAITSYGYARTRYLDQVGNAWMAGAVALKLADAERLAGKPEASIATLESALDDIRTRYREESLRADTGEERAKVLVGLYSDLVSDYLSGGAREKADDLVKKAKRLPWAVMVSRLKSSPDQAVAAYARTIELLAPVPDVQTPASATASVKPLAQDAAGFWETCTGLENLSSYRDLPIDPKSMPKIQASIPGDSLVIEYMPAEAATYVFVCGVDKTVCREIVVPRSSVVANVTKLRKVLKSCEERLGAGIPLPRIGDWQESAFLPIKEPLVGLYDQLLKPIAADFGYKGRLVFVLPEDFAGLPMHALISSGAAKTPRFLLEDYEISYLGPLMLDNLVSKDNRKIDATSDRLAIFADPEGNLPGAEIEARNIRSVYLNVDRWYKGPDATVSDFLKECSIANIVHIAAHHAIDPNPGNFSVTMADGTVGMRDLFGIINPNLRLIVLSECDAMGSSDPISSGPAVAAQAFSAIGARSVLGGLWKISDEAASGIMGDFYRNLTRGQTLSQALRGAQMSAIEARQFAHPFYWACFALYGNPR